MGVLQLYAWYYERGIFYVGIDRDGTGKRQDVNWMFASSMKKCVFFILSKEFWLSQLSLHRYDHMYTLEIYCVEKGGERTASLHKSITAFIDEEGRLLLPIIGRDVLALCRSLGDARKNK
jgi:hypothetical protein